MKRLVCVLVASLHLAGCTTLTTLPYPQGRFEAVESVQRKEFSPGRTLGLVVGIVLLAALMRSAHPIHGGFGGNTCWLCP